MKYKVGDKVKIREDLIDGKWYGNHTVVVYMLKYKGQDVTIENVRRDNCYTLKEEDMKFAWTDEMIECKVDDKPKNQIKNIKHITNGTTTVVIIDNKVKGIAKLHPKDVFDEQEGFRIAYARALGNNPFKEELECKCENEDINTYLWEKFKNGEIVVNCKTKKDAMEFLKYCHNQGMEWFSGGKLLLDDHYDRYNCNTCYIYTKEGMEYASKKYWEGFDTNIIKFKELNSHNSIKTIENYSNEELLNELNRRLKGL